MFNKKIIRLNNNDNNNNNNSHSNNNNDNKNKNSNSNTMLVTPVMHGSPGPPSHTMLKK